jgi:hypothetical protein
MRALILVIAAILAYACSGSQPGPECSQYVIETYQGIEPASTETSPTAICAAVCNAGRSGSAATQCATLCVNNWTASASAQNWPSVCLGGAQ